MQERQGRPQQAKRRPSSRARPLVDATFRPALHLAQARWQKTAARW
jgi:hypothetical protein